MTCRSALNTTKEINSLREKTIFRASSLGKSSNNHVAAEALFTNPVVTARRMSKLVDATTQTGANIIARFVEAGLLKEGPTVGRERAYIFSSYLALLDSAQRNFESFAETET